MVKSKMKFSIEARPRLNASLLWRHSVATRLIALWLLAAAVLLPGMAWALEYQKGAFAFDLNGYYKNLMSLTDTHDLYKDIGLSPKRFFFDDYNRMRLKTRLGIGQHLEAVCHYEALLAVGDTLKVQYETERLLERLTALYGPLPDEVAFATGSLGTPQIAPRFLDMEESRLFSGGQRMSHGMDRLFIGANSRYVSGRVGRMALSWGTGRVWNPTDMWAPFSPTELDKDEKRGVDLVTTTFHIPRVGSLEAVWAPLSLEDEYEIHFEDSSVGGRFRFHLGEYDVSIMGGAFGRDAIAGLDFSGYLWNAGFRGEAAYTFVDPETEERDYLRAVLSADYGFAVAWNPYLLVEGHFNGLGEADPNEYIERLADQSVQRQIRMGRSFNLGRDYLTVMTTIQPHALVTLALQPIVNLDDRSFMASFRTTYSVTDYADILIGAYRFFGDDNTEFGGMELFEQAGALPLSIPGLNLEKVKMINPDFYFLYLKAYF